MRARKIFLVNHWPILISLILLIGPLNHVILGIQIQFQNTHSNLTKLKLWKSPGHSGKLSLPWNWNWTWMWSWTSCWEFHFTFWFNNDSGIFVRFFLYSGVNVESCTNTPWNGITNLSWSHFIHGKNVWISILWFGPYFWTNFDSHYWLELIWVNFPSRYRSLFLFHLSPNQSSLKITLHYWTRILKKMTQ